ncbi:MAG: DUF3473 domain-containing protein [Candidatus Delongbacteria bacterium]|nr:DUF3473 domain-containing protein [Candidatus Delongbacteria bacterium]
MTSRYLSIDLELPSMASNLRAAGLSTSVLQELDTRLELQVTGLLRLLERLGLKATVFAVGQLALSHGKLLDRIRDAGHGIGCHGHSHLNLHRADPARAREDLQGATTALGPWLPAVGQRGFRAPDFSLDPQDSLFYRALAENGYRWSSSVMRARVPSVGNLPLELQLGRVWREPGSGVLELPLGGHRPFGIPLGHGGGFWLRVLPLAWSRWNLARDARTGALPQVYLHPWELDPDQPRLVRGWRGWRQYHGQASMETRLEVLCAGMRVLPLEAAARLD